MASLSVDIDVKEPLWEKELPTVQRDITTVSQIVYNACDLPTRSAEISIVLADDIFIQDLNQRYRGKDKPTNVLSFPATDDPQEATEHMILGDVIISYQTLQRESEEQSKTMEAHMVHMLVHGILHLIGYDHQDSQEAEKMEALEVGLLKEMGYANPYQ